VTPLRRLSASLGGQQMSIEEDFAFSKFQFNRPTEAKNDDDGHH
jgi:hypothetical protein